MRKATLFSTLILALVTVFPARANDSTGVSENSPDSEVRVYEVFGMDCPACQGGLTKLIKKVEGVSAAKAEWNAQRVKVTLEPGADVKDEDILSAIKKANFTPGKRIDPAAETENKE